MAVRAFPGGLVANQDSYVELGDDADGKWKIQTDGTNGLIAVSKDGNARGYIGRPAVEAKTGDYTVTDADWGKVFTTTGASADIEFTLPAPSTALAGMEVTFVNTVDFEMLLTISGGETLVALNNATADGLSFTTASEHIGSAARLVCDGTKWLALILTNTTATVIDA